MIETRVLKSFPTLYKKSSTGKIEVWNIWVEASEIAYPQIVTQFGEFGGAQQKTSDTITEGKNEGKKNETTPGQQAIKEATSKYEKKLKAGYIDDLERAEAGDTDKIIAGGVVPMLAHSFDDHGHKITFPCAVQPKLDGIRCIAIKNGDGVTLWTRTRKRIHSCPHIEEALAAQVNFDNAIFDGELYNHEFKSDFSKIISAVRKDKPSEESKKVQYHIYDLITGGDFESRCAEISQHVQEGPHIHIVTTDEATNMVYVKEAMGEAIEEGYEGVMLRNWGSQYENKRSYGLQKYKTFKSSEFLIVGAEEGRGKLQGHLGAFVCQTPEGHQFNTTMAVPQEQKKEMWEKKLDYIGEMLEVKYQDMTDTSTPVPRFPVGMRIRYPERGL